ncbi:MAG: GTP-binding protein [Thermoplasmata archaeon]|nr:GTP-binding protein [Thermoplasmata archaeon]
MQDSINLVIVGHVDHGKSTLIGRLLYDTGKLSPERIAELKKVSKNTGKEMEFAYVMDHLKEEREQNVTIDTAQTFFSTDKREYVIIDAPGHVEFTKNMVTGASLAEVAILIVSAREGVEEQTRRHAYILGLLGLKQVIVVINKMDTVGYSNDRFNEVKEQTISHLSTLGIEPSYVVPISAIEGDMVAKRGERMNFYEGPTMLEALDTFKGRESRDNLPLRFPIQDVYKHDPKRILVGRIESGKLEVGDKVLFYPSEKTSTIKTVELFEQEATEASAGMSIGITIAEPLFIERGEVMIHPGDTPTIADTIDANVFWMSRKPLKKGERLHLRCATQELDCTIKEIKKRLDSSDLSVIEENARQIENNEVGELTIVTDDPIVIEDFNRVEELGRFVLVKDLDVAAGGIVIMPKE